jgi:hypothetical protein
MSGFLESKNKKVIDNSSQAQRLVLRNVDYMTDQELCEIPSGSVFFFDVECYINFFFVAFKSLHNGKYVAFEQSPGSSINFDKMLWIMWKFCIVGFNSKIYDLPMITLAAKGKSCTELKKASDFIINECNNAWQFEKAYKVKVESYNHIDLIEVAPLQGSLKLYAARLHAPTIQDLPFEPSHKLTQQEGLITGIYCCVDLDDTEILYNELLPEIKLRTEMSQEYGLDLRSKSDAQLAEAVINSELQKVLGFYPKRPKFDKHLVLKYNVPSFINYKSNQLKEILKVVEESRFELDGNGSPIMPDELGKLKVKIGNTVYNLGMGGLHSQEKTIAYIADENTFIRDNDVASYYPRIILNQNLFPSHLGNAFLEVYGEIVKTRIHAKGEAFKAKKERDAVSAKRWKTIADSLKITINGSFGKFGNKYSTLYSPQLLLQVTLTGQLALLMLIEMQEEIGIEVVSGNTDGIISKYKKSRHQDVRDCVSLWESITNFETEETCYSAVYSRDVNNYVAIKEEGGEKDASFLDDILGCKTKGTYSEKGSALNSILSKNPEHLICSDALLNFVKNKTPVEETVRNCKDIRRFVSVRNVRGGAEKDGLYLGKVVRFYYAKNEQGCINYVKTGNKVPKSDGAKPLMDLLTSLPEDLNFDWYISKAKEMLHDCGALRKRQTELLFFG